MKNKLISELKSIIAIHGGFEVDNLVISRTEEMVKMITFLKLDYFEVDIARKSTGIVELIDDEDYDSLDISILNLLLDLAKTYKNSR